MTTKIKILLVDDHLVVRAGFRMLLAAGDAIEVIGEAERGEQAIQLYQELQPDMLVMDLSVPSYRDWMVISPIPVALPSCHLSQNCICKFVRWRSAL